VERVNWPKALLGSSAQVRFKSSWNVEHDEKIGTDWRPVSSLPLYYTTILHHYTAIGLQPTKASDL